jgi:SpoVK/Ycf46/Vps4 family AAA+-type ATPase
MSISPSIILDSTWGADEKNIRIAFNLSRKIHPCLIFVDEADGILARRKSEEKTTYMRTLLGEFLRHWDGASSDQEKRSNPFVLLASNTPWDIDPAALRRAPIRIYLDLPTLEERKSIFNIMLRDETLGPDISIDILARLTKYFSGSDIKNLCVSAATRCLQEQQPDENGKYEEKRVLLKRHFDFALRFVKPTGTDLTLARKMAEFQRAAH